MVLVDADRGVAWSACRKQVLGKRRLYLCLYQPANGSCTAAPGSTFLCQSLGKLRRKVQIQLLLLRTLLQL